MRSLRALPRSRRFVNECGVFDETLARTDTLFAVAEATWRAELARQVGSDRIDAYVMRPEGRGEPHTLLRTAFEVRENAYRAWRRARGLD